MINPPSNELEDILKTAEADLQTVSTKPFSSDGFEKVKEPCASRKFGETNIHEAIQFNNFSISVDYSQRI